tara:strand:- start:632 stop:856 length:225 start_codon:yes stop_codon:yes gene_type:complete
MEDEEIETQRDIIATRMSKEIAMEIDQQIIKTIIDTVNRESNTRTREAFEELDIADFNGVEPEDWALEQIASAL